MNNNQYIDKNTINDVFIDLLILFTNSFIN